MKLIYYRSGGGSLGVVSDTIIPTDNNNNNSENLISISEVATTNDFDLIIEDSIEFFFNATGEGNTKILDVYVDDKFVKTWKGEAAYLGDDVNLPYNYDSWEAIKNDEVIRDGNYFHYGDPVFTITDEDLETDE